MKPMKQVRFALLAAMAMLYLVSGSVQASHRVLMFNDRAMEKILDMWPEFTDVVDNQARGMEKPGERGILVPSPLRSHLNQLLREQPTPKQFGEGFKILVRDYYHPAGMTAFGSKVSTHQQVTGFEYLERTDGKMPIRFAWSTEMARQPIPGVAAAGLYETMGVQWQTIEYNPWLWLRGMSSEGDWDAPNRGCLGPDLPAKPGVDAHEVKDVLEICPDFSTPTVQALVRGLTSGWRWVGVHAVGSNAIRIFINTLEKAMKKNPDVLNLEYVRNMRNGFAHGTMTGAVPDVVAGLKKYNLYLPINVRRSLAIEPDNIRQNYGEPGWAFLAPVKTLLTEGVNVVGEGEIGLPNPGTYFDLLDVHVNREIAKGTSADRGPPKKAGEGIVYVPEEGIDRVMALKLFTYRSAQFHYAESKLGSLEPGKYADFIVTDTDYLKGPDAKIKDNKVIMTVQADDIVYRDKNYHPAVKQGSSATASR